MSETQTRRVLVVLPKILAREIKVAAARRGLTMQDWWKEACEEKVAAENERLTQNAE